MLLQVTINLSKTETQKATWKRKSLKNKSNDRDSNFLVIFSSNKA